MTAARPGIFKDKAEWEKALSGMKGAKVAIQTSEVQETGDWAYETDRVVQTFRDGSIAESKWLQFSYLQVPLRRRSASRA
jgi:hypothetical protein